MVQPPTPSSSLVSTVPEAAPGDGGDDDQVGEDAERADGAVHEEGGAEREGGAEGGPQDGGAQVDGGTRAVERDKRELKKMQCSS